MSNDVTYTFYLENVGEAVTDATPTFDVIYDLDASVLGSATVELAAIKYPTVVNLGGGFYYFVWDWATFPGDFYLTKINCGDESDFADPKQRFIIMKLDRNDNLHNIAQTIKTSSDSIVSSNSELLQFIKRLLEVEQGTWKIEEESGQWVLNLYPTKDDGETNARYEVGLDIDTPIAKYYLQDVDGFSSATNPFRRVQIAGNSILPLIP